jgi:hypothetical protein
MSSVLTNIFFLYPAGNFVVLRGTYFEQMAHWLTRERNYYYCIQEVRFASFWLLSAEPTEIVFIKKKCMGLHICAERIEMFPYILLEETFVLQAIIISVDILNGLSIQSLTIPCPKNS